MMPEMMVPGYVHAREPAGKERARDGGGAAKEGQGCEAPFWTYVKSQACVPTFYLLMELLM